VAAKIPQLGGDGDVSACRVDLTLQPSTLPPPPMQLLPPSNHPTEKKTCCIYKSNSICNFDLKKFKE
jgi:hypothetical protein